jgi:molybdopterin synthase sulfur carrier subunit
MEAEISTEQKAITELLCFGQLAEVLQSGRLTLHSMADTDALKAHLLEQYPALASVRFTMAVNRSIVHENTPLAPGDVVALMPPFSGG